MVIWRYVVDETILDIGSTVSVYCSRRARRWQGPRGTLSRRRRLSDRYFLPRRFVDAAIFRQWSGDSQKLYFWLRSRAGRDDSLAPDDYRQLRDEGYLVAYATAEEMMDRAVDCSRNTLTKLIRDLEELGVAQVRPARRGYMFLLGERLSTATRWKSRPVTVDVYYLDQIIASGGSPGGV